MKLSVLAVLLFVTTVTFGQKIKVACVGNSITEGAGIEESMRYPAQLQRMLGDLYEVRNYGVGGRTLLKNGDFPYWQEAAYKEVLAWIPDVVIIKLGTNDSKPQNWIYAEDFESNYREFIDSFKDLPGKRKIYICTPIPVFKEEGGISETAVRDEIIPIIRKIGRSENVPVIDLFAAMSDKSEMVPDGIHPDANGATVIAEEINKVVGVKLTQH